MTPTKRAFDAFMCERARQIVKLKHKPEHDDKYTSGELVKAAVAYATNDSRGWPWSMLWWKPKSDKRNIERAVALLSAEWERLDRKERKGK